MKRETITALLAFVLLGWGAGCSQYCVDVSLEGINYFVQHPSCVCCSCPYASPPCPYFDYDDCRWINLKEQPSTSAINAPATAPKPDDVK